MTGEITTYEGKRYALPEALSWKFEYACGVPCDSFFVELPWRAGEEEVYRKAVRFTAREAGKTVFTGVVDEAEWSLDRKGSRAALSGRSMAVYTDCPGVQFYAGNFLNDQGKDGVFYGKNTGVALETQYYPDALHHPEWPQPITKAGQRYHSETVYRFQW